MADTGDDIFNNLPRRRKRAVEDDDARSFFRERRGVYVPEGPLPPRPHASGKGGPSLTASNAPPVLSASPTITGSPAVGQTLTCSQGVWFNSPTSYTYQWKRDGTVISGATSATYVVVSADLGHSLTCTVTATNAFGSTPATSNAVSIVALPANTAAPVISGSLTVGSTLSCTQGTWTNSPTSYAYQWQRGGANISGATSSSYTTVTADGGTAVGCLVTATNAAGSASQASNTLAIAGGVATSVWSASDAAANGFTLTNGGLTVAYSGAANWASIRTSISKTSGKLYIEFYLSTASGGILMQGLASAGFDITQYLGATNYSAGLDAGQGLNFVSSGFTSNYAVAPTNFVSGDVWALAMDFAAGSIWLAQNNVWFNSSNPGTGSLPAVSFVAATVGALFAGMSFHGSGEGTWTLQPTSASLKYLPPPGFQAWDGGPVTPSSSVWSAADASANGMTLTNGGLTVTNNSVLLKTIRGSNGLTSGKAYVEFKAGFTAGNDQIGVANSGFNISGQIGLSNYSGGYNYGTTLVSAGFTANYNTTLFPATNDVWALAIDFNTGNMWVAQNNVWINSSNPATGSLPMISFVPATVGALFPALTTENVNEIWTLQPTAASQTYAPPAGFTPWG